MRPLMVTATLIAAPLVAQDPPDSVQQVQMALLAELAQPGPEHQRLAALTGDWDIEMRMPGGSSIPGHATNRMIMGGRFLSSEIAGSFGGAPFESLTIIGFDRGPKVYTAVGFDTFGTFYVTGEGPWNETEGRAVLSGSYADPVTGHAHDYEFLFTIHSPDHFTWTVVFLESGARVVAAEVDYRRH